MPMKKFVFRSILFLLPFVGLLIFVEGYVRSLPNTYKYKDAWMWENGHRVHTLILGNSHAYFALVPSAMSDSVFNLSNVSQRLEHDFFLLNRYAEACPNLQRIVLVADNSCLFDTPMEDDEPARVTYYQLYMGYDAHSAWSKYGFELSNMSYLWQKVRWHFQNTGHQCDSLGWGNNYVVAERNPDDFLYENVREHHFVDWKNTHRNRSFLDSIAHWCQQRQVRLVLLQTPVCADYTRKADARQLKLVSEMIDSCCNEYGAVRADYSCDKRFEGNDFFDSDHLSDQGAMKFSHIFTLDLSRLH